MLFGLVPEVPYHLRGLKAGFNLSQLLCYCFGLQTHILAKFFNGYNLVLFLTEVLLNFLNELPAVPVASACDYHNIFWVNAHSIHQSKN